MDQFNPGVGRGQLDAVARDKFGSSYESLNNDQKSEVGVALAGVLGEQERVDQEFDDNPAVSGVTEKNDIPGRVGEHNRVSHSPKSATPASP